MGKQEYVKVIRNKAKPSYFAMIPKKSSVVWIIFYPFVAIASAVLCLALYPFYLYLCLRHHFKDRKVIYRRIKT